MRHLYRTRRLLSISGLMALSAIAMMTAACGSPEAGPGQADTLAQLSSAASGPGTDFEALFYCKNVDGPVALERYLIGAQRNDGLPLPSSPRYLDALPPHCIVSPIGGVPPYSAEALIGGQELRRVNTGTTELTFVLPALGPGVHTVEMLVTDAEGKRGGGMGSVEVEWLDPNKVHLAFTTPAEQPSAFDPGVSVAFEVDYEVFEPSEHPQLGIESFLSQTYTVTWTFGDGTTETQQVDSRTGTLSAAHAYQHEGLYDVHVAVEGNTFGQRGEAVLNVDIRPAGSVRLPSGEVVQQWRLVQTNVNPAGAPLRSNNIERVFADDSLNNFVDRTVSPGTARAVIGTIKGKGTKESFIGSVQISGESMPEFLTVGETARFTLIADIETVLGADVEGDVLRLSGVPGQGDATFTITSAEPDGLIELAVNVPSPTALGDTIVITGSIDGCAACVIQWVYRYG